MEFLAIVFGLLLCWRLWLSNFHYNLHGDSMSSLAWAQADRVNSVFAQRGNIIFTTLSMHLDAHVAIATHIPGKLNVLYNRLSRNVSATDLDIDASKEYDARSGLAFISMLQLCDPDADLLDITVHTQLLRHCEHLLVQ
jgi:hypothetical protein